MNTAHISLPANLKSRVISATLIYKRISNSTLQTSTPINLQAGENCLAPPLAFLLQLQPPAAPRNASSGPYLSTRNSSTSIPAPCCRDVGPRYIPERTFLMCWRGTLISMDRFGLRRRSSSFCSWVGPSTSIWRIRQARTLCMISNY